MPWMVLSHPDFDLEVVDFSIEVRRQIIAVAVLLENSGPQLGRPHCDTLSGSRYANMKELRFFADDGVWRIAFAFDPERRAVLLVGGDKAGVSQKKFYKSLIRKADERFGEWLEDCDGAE